jgi:hypothetical protein
MMELEADENATTEVIQNVKVKLAAVHQVSPTDIVLGSLTARSVRVTYTIPNTSTQLNTLSKKFEPEFGTDYLKYEIHPTFSQLQIQRVVLRHGIVVSDSLAIVHKANAEVVSRTLRPLDG